jgi:hypothetical protein
MRKTPTPRLCRTQSKAVHPERWIIRGSTADEQYMHEFAKITGVHESTKAEGKADLCNSLGGRI